MRRLHLFEFEDKSWLPGLFRNYLTEILSYQLAEVYLPVIPKLKEWLQKSGCRQVIDLCSGASGPWLRLSQSLACEKKFPRKIILTDKYPNPAITQCLPGYANSTMQYHKEPVDARSVPAQLKGCRTLFTAFHHFGRDEAIALLRNAVAQKEAIAVFEFTERKWGNIMGMLLSPIPVLFMTPLVKPFKWGRIFWTYVLPVVPLLYLWDGIISHLRTYTLEELRDLVTEVKGESFEWEVNQIRTNIDSNPITFLLGYPKFTNQGKKFINP